MKLPRQVQEASDRADQLIAEMTPADTAPADTETSAEAESPEAKETTAKAESPKATDDHDYKAKYQVLQGKYNAEVPRLHAELRGLRDRADDLQRQLDEAAEKVSAAQSSTSTDDNDNGDDAIAMLRDEYGPEFASAIERMIENRMKPLQGKVEATEAERQKRLRAQEYQEKSKAFTEAVNDLVPDWEEIDQDPAFHAYLAEIGEDGRQRQVALTEAASRLDVVGAARFFAAFKRTSAYKGPGKQASTSAKRRLAEQAVPSTSGRDRDNSSEPSFTKDEVRKFYQNVAMNNISPEDEKRIEREIEVAMANGRIR